MMRAESDELDVSFELPDKLTIRQHMAFRTRLIMSFRGNEGDQLIPFWEAVAPLLDDWQSEVVPDPTEVDLDSETDVRVAHVVEWVANEAAAWWTELNDVPKN